MKKPDVAWIPDFVREWAKANPETDVARWIDAQIAEPGIVGPSPIQCMLALYPLAFSMQKLGGESLKIKVGDAVAIIARHGSAKEIDALYEKWDASRITEAPKRRRSKKP